MKARKRRGQVLPMIAVAWVFFMVLAAGMFDMIFLYAARAQLIAAVDAAAIAATRELVSGATTAEQQATMNRVVDLIFRANFPEGHFMSVASGFDTPTLDKSGPGTLRVTVRGFATMPTFFLRVLGKNEEQVRAAAVASRRDSNVMLTLDRSGSMNDFDGAPWAALNVAVPLFVNEFSEQNDRIGAVFYATNPFIDYTIQYPKGTQSFKSDIQAVINGHSPGGFTNISHSLYMSYSELRTLGDTEALNVIVLFSDGLTTALTNQFPVNTVAGGGLPWCEANATEPASPRWGTVTNQPRGPYRIDVMGQNGITNCFQSGGSAYTGGGSQAENLVTELPTTWMPQGSPDSFSILHPFNTGLPLAPIALTESNIVTLAGENLALNIANQARSEGILIYTIGLGPGVNPAFMRAIANDPASPHYNSAQPSGEYIFSSDSAGLIDAFLRVASSVTHLTQ